MPRCIAVLALLLAACAGTQTRPAPADAAVVVAQPAFRRAVQLKDYTPADGVLAAIVETMDPEDTLLCGMETPTGTHIAMRICRSELQLAILHQHTQEWLRKTRSEAGASYSRSETRSGP